MKNKPPHLPPKSCNVLVHRAYKSIWWILFLIFVAGLSSVALTLSTLVWFAPVVPNQVFISSQKNFSNAENIDLSVINSVKKRLWYIYDTRDKVDGSFYADSADKYQAVMFSSDGWVVAYMPDYRRGDERYWEGVDYQGTVYEIDEVFADSVSQLTYIKFVGHSFPFVSFSDWGEVYDGYPVWEVSPSVSIEHNMSKDISVARGEYKIWDPQLFFRVKDDFQAGNILINSSGEMVGVLSEDGSVIYGWLVENQYAPVLQNGVPDYKAIEWSGYMVGGYVNYNDLTKKVSGFYINKSETKVTSSTIGVGDVLTHIQGQSVNLTDLSRQILLSPIDFTATVYRDGQEFNIEVTKHKVLN